MDVDLIDYCSISEDIRRKDYRYLSFEYRYTDKYSTEAPEVVMGRKQNQCQGKQKATSRTQGQRARRTVTKDHQSDHQ